MIANTNLSGFMTLANNLESAHPGGILAVEGLNEVDGWSPSYNGLTSYAAAIKFQQDLYTTVKADSALNGVSVYDTTVAGITDSQNLGNLSAYADDANAHIYYGGGQPAYGWSPNDSTYYWTSWLNSADTAAPGRPTVVTETGATTTGLNANGYVGVDQTTQAKTILNSLMDAAKDGVAKTFIYELMDSHNNGATDPESNYGLFNWDGSAKPAAVALHNFTSILSAGGGLSGTPGSLGYSISGVPQWGGQMLFEQGNGTYDIVVWAEPDIWNESTNSATAAPNTSVSVTLDSAANVSIYDPLTGTSAVQSLGTTNQVNVNVTDHPIIIQVSSASGASSPNTSPASGTPASGSASTATGNFNADGHSDVLIENTAGSVVVGESDSSGHVTYAQVGMLGSEWSFGDSGDYLGNGHSQFLIENTSGSVDVADVQNGHAVYTQVAALGSEWKFVGSGDYLGDGKSDFLIQNTSGTVAIGEVGANGQATYTTVAALGSEWKFVGSGDFLGDGHSQFLIENAAGQVAVGDVQNGNAVYTQVAALGSEWNFVGSGDYLVSGHSQVLVENSAGQVAVGDVQNGKAVYTTVAALGSEWKFVGTGDYLGLGHDQFLIENSSGSYVAGDVENGQVHYTQLGSLGSEWLFHT
jgi:hypothetical protein